MISSDSRSYNDRYLPSALSADADGVVDPDSRVSVIDVAEVR